MKWEFWKKHSRWTFFVGLITAFYLPTTLKALSQYVNIYCDNDYNDNNDDNDNNDNNDNYNNNDNNDNDYNDDNNDNNDNNLNNDNNNYNYDNVMIIKTMTIIIN